ncbi:MAG: AraC family transcriptional regulator [Victivallaceae bacterium]|nr:AraC family transcriptional regulator [Victivallaceae bacterium]
MDKNSIVNDKKKLPYEIHRISGGMREVHRLYGLWIIGGNSIESPRDSYARCAERFFEFYSLSHMHDGGGVLKLPGQPEQELFPGDCVLISPHAVNRYGGSRTKPYIEDAIRFIGPTVDRLFRAGVLHDGVYRAGVVRKLPEIIDLARDPSDHGQIRANIALERLLLELSDSGAGAVADDPIDGILSLIREHPHKWYQVAELAERVNLSCDQFRRNFYKRTHMRPKEYMERTKLHLASELLMGSACSVSEIAASLGYRDPFHFSRRFKLLLGLSPAACRKTFGAAVPSDGAEDEPY